MEEFEQQPPLAQMQWIPIANMVRAFLQILENDKDVSSLQEPMRIAFGIKADDGLGTLIFDCWKELFQHHLHLGTPPTLAGLEGGGIFTPHELAKIRFERELAVAVASGRIAPDFQKWAQRAVGDESFTSHKCREFLSSRGGADDRPPLCLEVVLHPDYKEHEDSILYYRHSPDVQALRDSLYKTTGTKTTWRMNNHGRHDRRPRLQPKQPPTLVGLQRRIYLLLPADRRIDGQTVSFIGSFR